MHDVELLAVVVALATANVEAVYYPVDSPERARESKPRPF